jgi:hypothetical protein
MRKGADVRLGARLANLYPSLTLGFPQADKEWMNRSVAERHQLGAKFTSLSFVHLTLWINEREASVRRRIEMQNE